MYVCVQLTNLLLLSAKRGMEIANQGNTPPFDKGTLKWSPISRKSFNSCDDLYKYLDLALECCKWRTIIVV